MSTHHSIPVTKVADDQYTAHIDSTRQVTIWMEDGTDGGIQGRWVISYNSRRIATAPSFAEALAALDTRTVQSKLARSTYAAGAR
jgi:hypothetical protein